MATVTFSEKFNNAVSYLNGAITNVATTINVDSATALGLDNSTTSAYLSIISASSYRKSPLTSPETLEIVHVTAVSTNALTVTRGADNTTGLAFDDNDIIEMRNNVANLEDIQNAITDGTDSINVSALVANASSTIFGASGSPRFTIDCDSGVGNRAELYWKSGAEVGLIDLQENASRFRIATNTVGAYIVLSTDTNDTHLTLSGATGSQDADFEGDIVLGNPTVPGSAGATGQTGMISWDTGYIYICTATNTWKRVAIATW